MKEFRDSWPVLHRDVIVAVELCNSYIVKCPECESFTDFGRSRSRSRSRPKSRTVFSSFVEKSGRVPFIENVNGRLIYRLNSKCYIFENVILRSFQLFKKERKKNFQYVIKNTFEFCPVTIFLWTWYVFVEILCDGREILILLNRY